MNPSQRVELKNKIGEFLVEKTTDDISFTRSPVTGKPLVKLSKKYAKLKRKKGQPPIPNLQLTSAMLKELRFKRVVDGIEIGVFKNKEAKKADNHNKFSPESETTPVPRRPFIPKEDENYRPEIRKGVKQITKEFRKELGLKINALEY